MPSYDPYAEMEYNYANELKCDICFQVIGRTRDEGDEIEYAATTLCGHIFGSLCLANWERSSPNADCPVCRTRLDGRLPVNQQVPPHILEQVEEYLRAPMTSHHWHRNGYWVFENDQADPDNGQDAFVEWFPDEGNELDGAGRWLTETEIEEEWAAMDEAENEEREEHAVGAAVNALRADVWDEPRFFELLEAVEEWPFSHELLVEDYHLNTIGILLEPLDLPEDAPKLEYLRDFRAWSLQILAFVSSMPQTPNTEALENFIIGRMYGTDNVPFMREVMGAMEQDGVETGLAQLMLAVNGAAQETEQ